VSRISVVSRILDFRRASKEEVEIEAKKAFQALRDEEDILAGLEQSLSDTQGALAALGSRDIENIHELGLYYDYSSTLDIRISRQRQAIVLKTAELEAVRERLVEAYRDMKTVETLMERLVKERDKRLQRLETRQLDSIWNSAAARQSL